jgi:PleD family two-component response regulator
MSYEDIPILVVDDAKFSSAIIAKALRSGGFSNVRFTNNPLQALRSLEKRPAQILIADWLMPGMDGLELSRRVKKLDETNEHFTYVMLLTARDDFEALNEAFEQGVDDFLNKANLRAQLLPRVIAAQRIAARQNELLRTNKLKNPRAADHRPGGSRHRTWQSEIHARTYQRHNQTCRNPGWRRLSVACRYQQPQGHRRAVRAADHR